MPKVREPRELFLHKLGDILTAEKTIVKMLPKLQREAKDKQLAAGFKKHLVETKKQVSNVEAAFKKLGVKPSQQPCPGIDGIWREHDQTVGKVAPAMIDVFAVGSAISTEHYEIASYEGLIAMAKALGETQVVRLLEQNLKQEQNMLKQAKTFSRRLNTSAVRETTKQQKQTTRGRTTTSSRGTKSRTTKGRTTRGRTTTGRATTGRTTTSRTTRGRTTASRTTSAVGRTTGRTTSARKTSGRTTSGRSSVRKTTPRTSPNIGFRPF